MNTNWDEVERIADALAMQLAETSSGNLRLASVRTLLWEALMVFLDTVNRERKGG